MRLNARLRDMPQSSLKVGIGGAGEVYRKTDRVQGLVQPLEPESGAVIIGLIFALGRVPGENRDKRQRLVAGVSQKVDKGMPEGMEPLAVRFSIGKSLADADGVEVSTILCAFARYPGEESGSDASPPLRRLVGEPIREEFCSPFALGLLHEVHEPDPDQLVMNRNNSSTVMVFQRLRAFVCDSNEPDPGFFLLADVT